MYLGALSIEALEQIPFFDHKDRIILAKVPVMAAKFIVNYFSKRWVFERKIFRP